MNGSVKKLLFVTKNKNTAKAFKRYVKYSNVEVNEEQYFELYKNDKKESSDSFFYVDDLNELIKLLEKSDPIDMVNTILILDYSSLFQDFQEIFEGNKLNPIGKVFLVYPEIKIWILKEGKKDDELFGDHAGEGEYKKNYHFIVKSFKEIREFGISLKGSIQLFDPSGIRNYLKVKLLLYKIKFKQDNFKYLHSSRKNKFALSVDEEARHAMLWAYTLYNFGYSVLPVMTAAELIKIKKYYSSKTNGRQNTNSEESDSNEKTEISLICRDFDLQFSDIKQVSSADPKEIPLYWYRGVAPEKKGSSKLELLIGKGEKCKLDFNWDPIYNSNESIKTLVISQIKKKDKIKDSNKIIAGEKLIDKNGLRDDRDFNKYGLAVLKDEKLYINGISKEIEGMYGLLENKIVQESYLKSREFFRITKKRGNTGGHSNPSINGEIAEKLLRKAQILFNRKNFLVSALLASEALEILNGLSISGSMEALHLKLCSELHMELGIIGVGNFKRVIKDRIFDIRSLIYRIASENDEERRNAKMQIFNDLRTIYESYEQFDAAELMYNEVMKAELGIKDSTRYVLRKKIKWGDFIIEYKRNKKKN